GGSPKAVALGEADLGPEQSMLRGAGEQNRGGHDGWNDEIETDGDPEIRMGWLKHPHQARRPLRGRARSHPSDFVPSGGGYKKGNGLERDGHRCENEPKGKSPSRDCHRGFSQGVVRT